jgi:hypothetical protein
MQFNPGDEKHGGFLYVGEPAFLIERSNSDSAAPSPSAAYSWRCAPVSLIFDPAADRLSDFADLFFGDPLLL